MQADLSCSFENNERDNDVTEPSATRPEGVQLRARRNPRLTKPLSTSSLPEK